MAKFKSFNKLVAAVVVLGSSLFAVSTAVAAPTAAPSFSPTSTASASPSATPTPWGTERFCCDPYQEEFCGFCAYDPEDEEGWPDNTEYQLTPGRHSLTLFSFPSGHQWFVVKEGTEAHFSENGDGTAQLTGIYVDESDPTQGFELVVNLSNGSTDPTAGGLPHGPHLELDSDAYVPPAWHPVDPALWHFYPTFTGTLTGFGGFAGGVINIGRYGPPFQVGYGANGKNIDYGASGWLYYDIVSQPTVNPADFPKGFPSNPENCDLQSDIILDDDDECTVERGGDINIDLYECPPDETPTPTPSETPTATPTETPTATPTPEIECADVSLQATQFALDGGTAKLRDSAHSTARKLRKMTGKKRLGKRLLQLADEIHLANWILIWNIPSVYSDCPTVNDFCVQHDLTGQTSSYLTENQRLVEIIEKLTRRLSRLGKRKLARKINRRAALLAQELTDELGKVPASVQTCTAT